MEGVLYMEKELSQKDLEKIEIEIIRSFNRNYIIRHVPVYTLSEILSLKKISDLKKICKLFFIKGYARMEKQELIEKAKAQIINNPEVFKNTLYILNDNEWNTFKNAIDKKYVIDNKLLYSFFIRIQSMGFLEVFYAENNQYVVIPEEVKCIYKEIIDENFENEKALSNNLNKYATAATSIYGLITKDEFIELFNDHNNNKIEREDLDRILSRFIMKDSGYFLWGNFIVHSILKDHQCKYMEFNDKRSLNKPRFYPEKEEISEFSKPNFYENKKEMKEIKNFIFRTLKLESSIINSIIDEMHYLTTMGGTILEIINVFDRYFINLSMDELSEAADLIINMMNNTRLWINNGYTNMELEDFNKRPKLTLLKGNLGQDTRSEPLCICGSGKRYIDCCGKENEKN